MWFSTLSRNPQFLVAIVTLSFLAVGCPLRPEDPAEVSVPLVLYADLASAEEILEDAGLTIGTVLERPSGRVRPGEIIQQEPSFGAGVERGSAVNLVVATEPIRITSIERLQEIGSDPDYPLDGHYVLENDIDATVTATWNNGKGFDPVGKFNGAFNGQDNVITGLTIDRPGEKEVGLFGILGEDGVIERLALEDYAVTGDSRVGGLVGANAGTIEESYADGAVAGVKWVGGLAGANDGAVTKSSAMGVVEGLNGVGGLVGDQVEGTISESYALSTVTGQSQVGGLVGYNDHGTISDTYASGAVTGESQVGGLLGWNKGGTVSRSYASGAVAAEGPVGGLVGWDEGGEVKDSFWDTRTTNQDASYGGDGRPTGQMVRRTMYVEADWDFADVWDIDNRESYPYLREARGGDVVVPIW